jgi:hypothetical protein
MPIILEHRISDYFGIDGGLGLIMPYTIADFIKNDSNKLTALLLGLNPKFKNRSFGASLQIEPKFFISDDCIFSGHKGYNYLSIYCNFQGYRDQGIREFGLGYGVAVELSKINLQLITTFSLISLKRHHTNTDFKYNTSPLFSDELTANRFRLFFRLLIGFRSSRLDKYF